MARPRKSGDRYDCGKLRPAITVNQIRRGRDAVLAAGKHSWLGSQIGWLATAPGPDGSPLISPAQCEAGLAFARLFRAMASEVGIPARAPRSCAFGEGECWGGGAEQTERTSDVLAAYAKARSKLESVDALDIVVAVCVDDQAPPRWDRARLVKGLNALSGC